MRFLTHEYQDVQQAILSRSLDPGDFSNVKRKGRMHIHFRTHPEPFTFFRKKKMILTAEGKWEEELIYTVYEGGKGREMKGWTEVLARFESWLDSL